MLSGFFGRFSKNLGVDLGTSNTLIVQSDKGIVVDSPTVVAINNRTNQIIAVGHEAKDMVGKIPPYIDTYIPLSRGVISDYEITEKMLRFLINRVHEQSTALIPRPRVLVGVPLEATEVERKAVEDVVLSAGAREVIMVEDVMAAAVGARLPIEEPVGSMIVDVGGGKTEVAVISLGGIVEWSMTPISGIEMNKQVVSYTRDVFNLLLGEMNAEIVKIQLGSAVELPEPLQMTVRGRDVITGLPKEVLMTDTHVREAIDKTLKSIVEVVKNVLEVTPPELVADIHERGMVLVGGGSMLRGLDTLIERETDIAVRVTDDPLSALVRGMGVLFESAEPLATVRLPSARE